MEDYWNIPGFEDLCLEDSWILVASRLPTAFELTVEIVLKESHPQFARPLPGEQYCYRKATLTFGNLRALSWSHETATRTTDASGEGDLGSFDNFSFEKDVYYIDGDIGQIRLKSDVPRIAWLDS